MSGGLAQGPGGLAQEVGGGHGHMDGRRDEWTHRQTKYLTPSYKTSSLWSATQKAESHAHGNRTLKLLSVIVNRLLPPLEWRIGRHP